MKIPSTPNIEYYPDIFTSSDHEQSSSKSLSHFLRLQESSSSSSFKSDATDKSTAGGGGVTPKNLSGLIDVKKSPLLQQRKLINTPESSQTDSDDVSPQIQRKRKTGGHVRDGIPRFSISIEDDRDDAQPLPLPTTPIAGTSVAEALRRKDGGGSFELADALSKHRSRAIVKSASDLGLSLLMRSEQQHLPLACHLQGAVGAIQSPIGAKPLAAALASMGGGAGGGGNGGSSSTASSRDTSPCRDLSPLVTNLKPPIVIRRGPRGFGFTVHTVRVFYGDTDFYTMHHLVAAVEENSPAFEAGLRPADLITHVNGEPVQGLYHTQVLQLLLSCSEHVMIRATPLTNTSIQSGGRKRDLGQSKMAKRSVTARYRKKKDNEKKRKTSLFRRISNKRANAEIQQLTAAAAGLTTPTNGPPCPFGGPGNRLNFIPFDSASSQSSSPNSSVPNTPTGSCTNMPLGGGGGGAGGGGGGVLATSASSSHLYQRPSSLHGLKHKLHSSKGLHAANTPTTPNRRKSVAHIPLSPLARTPSPTRSPSPLTFPTGHHPGSSNTTQSYSPTVGSSSSNGGSTGLVSLNVSGERGSSGNGCPQVITGSAIPALAGVVANNNPSNCIVTRRSFNRPKSAEHNNNSSPLLRRALSPDRPHLRVSEGKCTSVSPLCNQPAPSNSSGGGGGGSGQMGVGGAGGSSTGGGNCGQISTTVNAGGSTTTTGIWRSPSVTTTVPQAGTVQAGGGGATALAAVTDKLGKGEEGLTLNLQTTGELLPRIAEEKDSPTGSGGGLGSDAGKEILRELKGVKVEPMAGDVKDKIRRFSFGAQLEQKLEVKGLVGLKTGMCDKLDVVAGGETKREKKKDDVVAVRAEKDSARTQSKGASVEKEKSISGEKGVNLNVNQPPTTGQSSSSSKKK